MNNIEIRLGDALDLFKEFSDQSVDLIIADPPYNLGKDYGNSKDAKDFDEYLTFSRDWLAESARVLKETGTIYAFMGFQFISYLNNILDRELGLIFNSWICWHYTQGMGKTKGFSPRHDDILMYNKSSQYKFNLDNVRVPQKYYRDRNNMRGANPGDVWSFSHVHYCHPNRQSHPTQKPEGLLERMVLASSDEGELVLDPFCGSGTTLRVCQQLGRNCVGFELNPEYVEMTKARLAQPFTGFDSIDPRMERVPLDLRDREIRDMYLKNHTTWFLKYHQNAEDTLRKRVKEMYGDKIDQPQLELVSKKTDHEQMSIFGSPEERRPLP
jgi:site-specific DNA-methyltransferase (adenine-specific)